MRAEFTMLPPATLQGSRALRSTLLEFFIDCSSASELSQWLQSIGQSIDGTSDQKRARLRQATKFVDLEASKVPRSALSFLLRYGDEQLSYLCEILTLSTAGNPEEKVRRVMRHIGTVERWLPAAAAVEERPLLQAHVRPFIEFHIVSKDAKTDDEFSMPLIAELIEIFGAERVLDHRSVGTTTREIITVHIGDSLTAGVGVLVQRPATPAEVRSVMRKVKLFKTIYQDNFVLVLLPEKLDQLVRRMAISGLLAENVAVILK
jgi:hypothetical protein